MPRLPVIRAKEVVGALQKAGFVEVRSRGSHMQLKRGNLLVTVPILRQAKLTAEELEPGLNMRLNSANPAREAVWWGFGSLE